MVMPSKEAKSNGAAGIDAGGGRRPTAVPAPAEAGTGGYPPLWPYRGGMRDAGEFEPRLPARRAKSQNAT